MNIKEVEKLLSISRSNIRFYEKQGLLKPNRGQNNYRDYSDADIATLKKIIVLRKLGFSVEEISEMQKGSLSFSDANTENIARLEKEIETLKGALELSKEINKKETSYETLNEDQLWDKINQNETKSKSFVDIGKDYLMFELDVFDNTWKYAFLHNFKSSRKKYGIPIACLLLLLICIIRGFSRKYLWHETFWEGFLYSFSVFAIASAVLLPIYLIGRKWPEAAAILWRAVAIIGICFIFLCLLYIIIGFLFLR